MSEQNHELSPDGDSVLDASARPAVPPGEPSSSSRDGRSEAGGLGNSFLADGVGTDIENPHAPLAVDAQERTHPVRWRIIPAATFFAIGVASLGIGLAAVAIMTYVLLTQQANERVGGMIAGCSMYLGFGASWSLAGWLYWHERYRYGLIATTIGALIPAVLFAILGA